ncbi:MAG: hypothetical protein KF893_06730 [Caldilineaceae bacterium]|nr:hypothetical protein [Caldilineaceae bacterium]
MQSEETKRPIEPEDESSTPASLEEDERAASPVSSFHWDETREDEEALDEAERISYEEEAFLYDEKGEEAHASTIAYADDEVYDGADDDPAPILEEATRERPPWTSVSQPAAFAATGIASSANRPHSTPTFEEEQESMDRPSVFSTREDSPRVRPTLTPLSARTQVGGRLPLAHQPKLAEIDPTLYEYWREHIHQGFQRNNRMFDTILDAFMRPYNTTIWMYRILFGLGIAAFLVAAGLGAWLREPVFSLIFGGLSIVSFLTYFLGRPLQSLEENLKFITWLGIIYNTYWTRLVYMMDSETIHADLEDATQDAINELERLLDKHHDFSGKRPGLR